ncbi:MAG: sulfatase-like hydrolase/transferase [Planctomycetes bacterium]|nr:sulfatase-like hydrolase/transferase [Planctomycetota bacterium]
MLAESFQQAGYDTGAFVAAYVLHSRWGLSRGFATYNDSGVHGVDDLGGEGHNERRGDEVLDVALPWLLQQRQAPFFGWVHLYDPHAPYEAPDNPKLVIDTSKCSPQEAALTLIEMLEVAGKISTLQE